MTTLAQTTARLAQLRKHHAMLNAAQANLSSAGRFVNAGRIREASSEIESIELWISIVTRDGGVYQDDGEFVAVA